MVERHSLTRSALQPSGPSLRGQLSTSWHIPGIPITAGSYLFNWKNIRVAILPRYSFLSRNFGGKAIRACGNLRANQADKDVYPVATPQAIFITTNPAARIGTSTAWKISPSQ